MCRARFTGDQGAINLFPQNGVPDGALRNFNGSAMVKLENELADWVSAGAEVDYRVTLGRMDDAGRPGSVEIDYVVRAPNGEEIYDNSRFFRNEAGQEFVRRSREEIIDMIAAAE